MLFRLHNEKQQGAVDRGSKVDSKVERRGMQERPWVEGEEVMSNEMQKVCADCGTASSSP